MAGRILYTGKMLKSMEDKISDLQTDIGDMSTDMAAVVSEIISLKEYVSSGIVELPVGLGNDHVIVFNDSVLTNPHQTEQIKAAFTCLCSGALGIKAEISATSGYNSYLSYRINGGSWVIVKQTNSTAYQNADFNLTIKQGDKVDISLRSSGNGFAAYLNAGMSVNYNIIDIVGGVTGAIAIG